MSAWGNDSHFGNFGSFGNFGQTPTIATSEPKQQQSTTQIGSEIPLPPGLHNEDGSASSSGGAAAPAAPEITDLDKFGLKGLLPMLRLSQQESSKLALGTDLNYQGFDLRQSEKLSTTFQSPWVDTSIKEVEPAYKLPDSVKQLNQEKFVKLNLQPAENRMSSYSEDTLFFIFYSKPKDIMQELAARELKERNWRFHKKLKMWLAKIKDQEPTQDDGGKEHGIYTIFDPQSWQKVIKEMDLEYSAVL